MIDYFGWALVIVWALGLVPASFAVVERWEARYAYRPTTWDDIGLVAAMTLLWPFLALARYAGRGWAAGYARWLAWRRPDPEESSAHVD